MKRYSGNPILTRESIPEVGNEICNVSSVFNPAAAKIEDRYLLLLRVQTRGRKTYSMLAESSNGKDFKVIPEIVEFEGLEHIEAKVHHIYDPRITVIENKIYVTYALDFDNVCRIGLFTTTDFEKMKFIGLIGEDNTRNGVLFPEKFDDSFYLLERPNEIKVENGPITGNQIILSKSNDLINWERVGTVAEGNFHYWDELIGSGPPPVKTKKGWLHIYHGIALHYSPVYQAGVMLLDLNDPTKVIARSSQNILEPREVYELTGQVPNVIFPSGLIVEEYDEAGFAKESSEVKLYYGAADTSVCLAYSNISRLINQCYE